MQLVDTIYMRGRENVKTRVCSVLATHLEELVGGEFSGELSQVEVEALAEGKAGLEQMNHNPHSVARLVHLESEKMTVCQYEQRWIELGSDSRHIPLE